jgi:hypothetical protein
LNADSDVHGIIVQLPLSDEIGRDGERRITGLEFHLDVGGRVGAGALLEDGEVRLEPGELCLLLKPASRRPSSSSEPRRTASASRMSWQRSSA